MGESETVRVDRRQMYLLVATIKPRVKERNLRYPPYGSKRIKYPAARYVFSPATKYLAQKNKFLPL